MLNNVIKNLKKILKKELRQHTNIQPVFGLICFVFADRPYQQ